MTVKLNIKIKRTHFLRIERKKNFKTSLYFLKICTSVKFVGTSYALKKLKAVPMLLKEHFLNIFYIYINYFIFNYISMYSFQEIFNNYFIYLTNRNSKLCYNKYSNFINTILVYIKNLNF